MCLIFALNYLSKDINFSRIRIYNLMIKSQQVHISIVSHQEMKVTPDT